MNKMFGQGDCADWHKYHGVIQLTDVTYELDGLAGRWCWVAARPGRLTVLTHDDTARAFVGFKKCGVWS